MSPRLKRRARALLRLHGPAAPIWRKRLAIGGGAVLIGLAALAFAEAADTASRFFAEHIANYRWLPLLVTPLGFAGIVWATDRFASASRGSGIPQVIASTQTPGAATTRMLQGGVAAFKFVCTLAALAIGASVGREGPTVQLAASIMAYLHRWLRAPIRASVMIAGGAAGVSAAFNTPLAGVAFAIEELAAAYEQRMTLLVMTAVLIAGMTSLGIAGDYVYFGANASSLPLRSALVIAPVAGVFGGLAGGLFARLLLSSSESVLPAVDWLRRRPIRRALLLGLVVAVIGTVTQLTWGTGYAPARAMIEGSDVPIWFGIAKFATTLATSISGMPGGIFSPSLATGAGIGNLLAPLFPSAPAGAVVLLGMGAYFTGVVRAPLTAVIIIMETTASQGLLLPLLAAALIADGAAKLVCRERLYHGLARQLLQEPVKEPGPA